MGLDILLFLDIKETDSEESGFTAHNIECFKHNCTQLEYGKNYDGQYSNVFSRSYSYWSYFRDFLAGLFGKTTKEIWSDLDKFKDFPFMRLINFADNEGTIDWIACKELSEQFKEHYEKAEKQKDDRRFEVYLDIMEATEIAANNRGCLVFA